MTFILLTLNIKLAFLEAGFLSVMTGGTVPGRMQFLCLTSYFTLYLLTFDSSFVFLFCLYPTSISSVFHYILWSHCSRFSPPSNFFHLFFYLIALYPITTVFLSIQPAQFFSDSHPLRTHTNTFLKPV